MTSETPSIAAIVLGVDRLAKTRACVASLLEAQGWHPRIQLLDNGSHDGTGEAIAAEFAGVRVERSETNIGAAAGRNLAVTQAVDAALKARLSEEGAIDSVQFLGHRHDVPDLLHAADVLALPSRSEGLPLAALEGLASSLPVVAHAVGGVPELIKDGENGRLVPPEPDALAAALIEVLTNSTLRSDLALRARPSVQRLALASYAERLEHMYRQTVASRPRNGARARIQSTSSSSAS